MLSCSLPDIFLKHCFSIGLCDNYVLGSIRQSCMRGTLEMHRVMLLRMYFSGSRIQVAICRLLSQKLRKMCLYMTISAQKTAWYVGLFAMMLNLDVEWCFVRTSGKLCRGTICGKSKLFFTDYRTTTDADIDFQGYKHYQHRKIAPLFAFRVSFISSISST